MANVQTRYIALSIKDYERLKTYGRMLNDNHMFKFEELLRIQSNSVFDMQSTLLLQTPEFIVPIREGQRHIQILFSGFANKGHWICTYYDGVRLNVFDSVNERRLTDDHKSYLSRLFPFHPQVVFVDVDQQPLGSLECGVYSIAFATSILFNEMPNTVNYKTRNNAMRNHLETMYKDNRLTPFPSVRASNIRHLIVENSFFRDRIQNGKPNPSRFSEIPPRNNLKRVLSDKHLNIKHSLNDENEKKKLRVTSDNVKNVSLVKHPEIENPLDKQNDKKILRAMKAKERMRKARREETDEQKIIRKENDRLKKRHSKEIEMEVQKKERQQRDLICKKKKLSKETEDEKKERQEKNLLCKTKQLFLENEEKKQQRQEKCSQSKRNKKNNKKLETTGVAIKSLEAFEESIVSQNYLGLMNVVCQFCGALHFLSELPADKLFNSCCHKGKVILNDLSPYPDYLHNLLFDSSSEGKNFRENIRSYNSASAFASMGAKLEIPKGRGPFVFRIHGQVYHNTYDLHPNNSESRKYGQLYILDTNQAVLERLKHDSNKKFLPSLMKEIDELLRYINPYAKAFKMMREVELEEEIRAKLRNEPMRDIQMWIKRDRSLNQSKFNVPSCNEVAVVFVSEDGEPPVERDICIHPRNDKSIPIHNLSANADPMIYPLVFPAGDPGWTVNIKQKGGTDRDVTLLQFYIFRLSYRGKFNPCLQMGKLTQQLIVDFWSKVEGLRISYIYSNQKKLRAELYCGLMDYLYNKAAEENVRPGRIIVLPSTFTGGPRSYQQFFMDAMRLVQEFGKPDLFITMTCNPKWCEITENLLCGETASDRPDIVARVFQQKVKALMIELKDNQIFGPVIAYVYVIEFQKRGLPHVHLIVFLDQSHAIRDAETVDKIICAEIPDEAKHPELFNIVKQFQVHGPCGKQNMNSPCMNPETKVCTKHYPKPFTSETDYSKNYPEYRRRNDGRKIIFYNKDGSIKCTADNSMIVPYNPYLSKKFACHINVVACGSIGGVKYLFKYCYKGHDCAIVGIKDNNQVMNYDEPQHYLNTRYVCPPEAMHRLLEFNMHEQSHATYRLAVHLPDHQTICFTEGMEQKAIDTFKNTTLTAWFELNKKDPEAHKYLYSEIPHNYVFIQQTKTWKKRERITKPLISRMYFVSPKDIERYWLRTLLLYVRGAKSFEDVRTYEGIRYNSFTEAARARNLMVDDNEWDNCLTEAVNLKFPKELCRLFAYICVFGLPANAIDLWNKYKDDMIFDNNLPAEVSIQKSLILINEVLNFHGFSLHQFGLPNIDQKLLEQYNSVDTENNALALKLLKEESNILIESLNNEQRQVFDDVLMAVYDDNCENRYIYLDGPGGSGKSYLHNTIITTVESQGLIVLSVAWTGIAANLLKGGRTSHNMFKFPIPINEDSKCNISGMSKHAEIFRKAKIIIWDEITMAPKYALQAMECMLRDITKCSKPFGGKVILLSGDFRQTLPIVPHGNRTHIVEVCVKNSRLWQHFKSRSLHANVRLNNDQIEFSNWLLNVGDGKPASSFEKENNVLEIPEDLISNGNLIDEIYGSSISPNDSSVYSSCILSLTNAEVLDMNECILSRLEAEEVVYYSNDSHVDDDNPENINNLIPIEFLNSLTPDGLPPHKLPLKVGCIIMLLRNLNLAQGLCNGTRLVVKSLLQNVILAEIISGKSKGEVVFIPRIDLSPSQDALPFKMVRRQFPIRLAYAMTINKSQGQSFDKVGIYLPISAFGHGQVYVGGSRVKSKENLKILAVNSAVYKNSEYPEKLYVKNIVYHEIL